MEKNITQFLSSYRVVKSEHHRMLVSTSLDIFYQWLQKTNRSSDMIAVRRFISLLRKQKKNPKIIRFYQNVLGAYLNRKGADVYTKRKNSGGGISASPASNIIVLSKTKVDQLLSNIVKPHHYLMLALIYGAGLKVGELVSLKISDIDFSHQVIHIHTKGGREAPLPSRIIPKLRSYIQSKESNSYLFPGRGGKQLTPRSVQYVFQKYAKNTQIAKKTSVNALRHSFAVHLLEQGVAIKYVQKLLGHKNNRTTKLYQKLAKTPLQNIASPL